MREREINFNKEKLKNVMIEKGYSQNHLSKMINVSQSQLSYYLAGKGMPTKKTVEVLAQALGVETKELLNTVENDNVSDYQDILDIAQELGQLRYKLIEKIRELGNSESTYNSQDQDFLHKIENIDDLSEEEALRIIREEQKKRKERRRCKERRYLIQLLLNGILHRNPSALITKVIEKSKDWTYMPRVTEQLKQDSNLYDTEKEQAFLEKRKLYRVEED